MKKVIICIIMLAGLLSCTALNAQSKHEFSIFAGGGLSGLRYATEYSGGKNEYGGQIGLGYRYFFSSNLGFVTGAEVSLYRSRFSLNSDNFATSTMAVDHDYDDFEFRSSISEYEETQNALFLQIPLMIQFQKGKNHQFYIAAGGKIGIPVGGNYRSAVGSIENSGYYSEEDYEYTTQKFMGFGTFKDNSFTGDLKFKTAFFASVETGAKWKLKDGLSLYSGVYVDYGLNNICEEISSAKQFVSYNRSSPRDFSINSVLNSQYAQNSFSQTFTDKIIPVSVGIKLSLTFGSNTQAQPDKSESKAPAENRRQ
ncbi:MAG: PorT family protein [Prevotellaceae bacterium]|nr:PorT family protein [Prevotellaceae bacterium]